MPVEIDNENEYEVEEILDARMNRRKLQYLVRWKGYSQQYDSWEPEENLDNAQELVRQFHKRFPTKPVGRGRVLRT